MGKFGFANWTVCVWISKDTYKTSLDRVRDNIQYFICKNCRKTRSLVMQLQKFSVKYYVFGFLLIQLREIHEEAAYLINFFLNRRAEVPRVEYSHWKRASYCFLRALNILLSNREKKQAEAKKVFLVPTRAFAGAENITRLYCLFLFLLSFRCLTRLLARPRFLSLILLRFLWQFLRNLESSFKYVAQTGIASRNF